MSRCGLVVLLANNMWLGRSWPPCPHIFTIVSLSLLSSPSFVRSSRSITSCPGLQDARSLSFLTTKRPNDPPAHCHARTALHHQSRGKRISRIAHRTDPRGSRCCHLTTMQLPTRSSQKENGTTPAHQRALPERWRTMSLSATPGTAWTRIGRGRGGRRRRES